MSRFMVSRVLFILSLISGASLKHTNEGIRGVDFSWKEAGNFHFSSDFQALRLRIDGKSSSFASRENNIARIGETTLWSLRVYIYALARTMKEKIWWTNCSSLQADNHRRGRSRREGWNEKRKEKSLSFKFNKSSHDRRKLVISWACFPTINFTISNIKFCTEKWFLPFKKGAMLTSTFY